MRQCGIGVSRTAGSWGHGVSGRRGKEAGCAPAGPKVGLGPREKEERRWPASRARKRREVRD